MMDKKLVSYDFEMDNFVAVKAPEGTDPDTLVDQALNKFARLLSQPGEVTVQCFQIFDPDSGVSTQLPGGRNGNQELLDALIMWVNAFEDGDNGYKEYDNCLKTSISAISNAQEAN
jgi:hypothetical protein